MKDAKDVFRIRSCNIFWKLFLLNNPVDTGRKLNVDKTFRSRPERPMYVQFMSYVYGEIKSIHLIKLP